MNSPERPVRWKLSGWAVMLLCLGCHKVDDPAASTLKSDTPARSSTVNNNGAAPENVPDSLQGCWQGKNQAAPFLARLDSSRCLLFEKGRLQVFGAAYRPGRLIMSSMGRTYSWQIKLDGNTLSLESPDGSLRYHLTLLREVPPELELKPFELPRSVSISRMQIQEIQKELGQRKLADQEVRRNPDTARLAPRVDADNTAYLIKLIQKVGWIDTRRFGREAAGAAVLITLHSDHLRLMLTAIPFVEVDARAHRISTSYYASMYDRLQVLQARKQRYGSQIGLNDAGERVIMPVEDPAKVDTYRRALRLNSWEEYLQQMEKTFGFKVQR